MAALVDIKIALRCSISARTSVYAPHLRCSRLTAPNRQHSLRLKVQIVLLSICLITLWTSTAQAFITLDDKSIDAALVYGMKNHKQGLVSVLGPNWIEGDNGALLNVYSPFMMLATKASQAGMSDDPTPSDLDKARKHFTRDIDYYKDPKNRLEVKFAVSFYGANPDFAQHYKAHIVGFGRGQSVNLPPAKTYPDKIADRVAPGNTSTSFVAINAYYFMFSDLVNLHEFELVLDSPDGPSLIFPMNNDHLY